MELKEQIRIPEIESIGNKGTIFQWTGELVERTRVSQGGERVGSRRERVAASSNGGPSGHKVSQGSSVLFADDEKNDWTQPRCSPSLFPGIGVLIRRKWSVFSRDNAFTLRSVLNAFAVLTRPLELLLPSPCSCSRHPLDRKGWV